MKNIYAAERMCSICKTKSEQIISNSRSCRAFWRGILDNTRQLVSVNNSSAAVVKGERSKMRCKPQNAERCFCEQALRCLTHGVIELLLHVHSRKQGVGGTSLFTESFLSYVCMCWLNSSLCICRNGMERTTAWSTILKNAIPNITPPLFVWFFYFVLRHGFPFLLFNYYFLVQIHSLKMVNHARCTKTKQHIRKVSAVKNTFIEKVKVLIHPGGDDLTLSN